MDAGGEACRLARRRDLANHEALGKPEVAVRPRRDAEWAAARRDPRRVLGDHTGGRIDGADLSDGAAVLGEPEGAVRPRRDADRITVRGGDGELGDDARRG